MKQITLLLTCGLFFHFAANSQVKVYKLLDKTQNANFGTEQLRKLNQTSPGVVMLNSIFKPVKGKFTVYRFIAESKGLSHATGKTETFHHLVILKTNNSGVILDAYQYTLEWAEEPFTWDLYRASVKNIILRPNLSLAYLKFQQMESLYYVQPKRIVNLTENGILTFKTDQ